MDEQTLEFAYKTAPVGARYRLRVERDGASLENAKSGRLHARIVYRDLRRGRWSESAAKFIYLGGAIIESKQLDLIGPGGSLRLRQGKGRPATKREPDRDVFYGACAALLAAAASANPELRIELGSTGVVRWAMSTLGAVAFLGGAIVVFASFGALIDRAWEDAAFLFALGLALVGSGLSMAIAYNPFRKHDRIAAGALAKMLSERVSGVVQEDSRSFRQQ